MGVPVPLAINILLEARPDSGQDGHWKQSNTMLPLIAQIDTAKDVYWKTSAVLIPAICQAAYRHKIKPFALTPREQILSGSHGEVDADGGYPIEVMLRFGTDTPEWEEASAWLLKALENVQHPDIRLISMVKSRAFFS